MKNYCEKKTLFLFLAAMMTTITLWGARDPQYYAFHNKDKGYLKQCKGWFFSDGTFRYSDPYDNNGSSIWVFTNEGYLQNEMFFLNVANGQSLYLSTTPSTQWSMMDEGEKKRIFYQAGSVKKYLCADGGTPQLKETPTNYYNACPLTVTEKTGSWATEPAGLSFEVQSPQLVTFLRTYYTRKITVVITKNDNGQTNQTLVNEQTSRSYCRLEFVSGSYSGQGTDWSISTSGDVIINRTTQTKTVKANYNLTLLDPIVAGLHSGTTTKEISLKLQPSPFTPDATKDYLLFYTLDANYRLPYYDGDQTGDPLKPDGTKNKLTEPSNREISYKIIRDDEGFYYFRNVKSGLWLRFNESHTGVTGCDYGVVEMGESGDALPHGADAKDYKFRLFKSGSYNNITTYRILPYGKQWAVYAHNGILAEAFTAFNVYRGATPKVISVWKPNDDSRWCFFAYEAEDRLKTDFEINGPNNTNSTGEIVFNAQSRFFRAIKGSPTTGSAQTDLEIKGSENNTGLTFEWEIESLEAYTTSGPISTNNGKSTFTVTVNSLPLAGSIEGAIKTKASKSSLSSGWKKKPFTLFSSPTVNTTPISTLSQIVSTTGAYKLINDINAGDVPGVTTFSGLLDGDGHHITSLSQPLFTELNNATVRNLNIDNVTISQSGQVGAVACVAKGGTAIYNIGLLGGSLESTGTSTENNSDDCCGGLVGLLDGSARVVNCFSYATIKGGNRVGGIVGYNNYSTTSALDKLKTMVYCCMFYGDITGGNDKAPIYNGLIIKNTDASGVSNYNYFRAEASYVQNRRIQTYNCALMAETRYLQRFEFFRHLLNSHRELSAWWVTGSMDNEDLMMKWVMEPEQIGSSTPYPILKTPGRYRSVVYLDDLQIDETTHTGTSSSTGTKLNTLTVHIQMGSGGAIYAPPTGASITIPTLTLDITDKDPGHFNFNYYKVQLPYYNDVGTKNYNGNRVVTGWKIVSIDGGTTGSFTAGDDAVADATGALTSTPYNFADRQCTAKDLYSSSGRVFNQGAYWDVPEGVTSITIEPYWAKAAYLSDAYPDVVYNTNMGTPYNVPNVGGGLRYTNGSKYEIAGEEQVVYTSVGNARNALDKNTTHNVYDNAIVLVGNAHNIGVSASGKDYIYTIMSADLDHDNEPDNSYILRYNSRCETHPVRVDFINIPGLGMAQKSTGGEGSYNFGIMQPVGWFESTNTSLFRVTQFEYDRNNRDAAPYIVQGGVFEQWVSGQSSGVQNRTTYFHLGGNVWFKEFHRGTHQDQTYSSKHPPVSVTGGDFEEFYLTGLYRGDIANYDDNVECYINGGRFGVVAGAGMEGVGHATNHTNGNVNWQIDHADIREFYGGGINGSKPIQGSITTVISNSSVDLFCGGPKFGNMNTDKTVITTATNCSFGTYFGAGYGGNSYSRRAPTNKNNKINIDWNSWVNEEYTQKYNASYGGVETQFDYQFLPMSGNADNVCRLFVEYVSFSLAETRNVTSKLTGCSIRGNFYGGGNLGTVKGPVTSTLDNCTVQGNVFGAGYSASLPTVEVMDLGGFVVEPYYYPESGTYNTSAVQFPATTTYSWQHANSVNSTATAINTETHVLYTTENLSKTNLGSVSGAVTLTIKGNTTVGDPGNANTGNVFGGGDESFVNNTDNPSSASTTVILQGSTHVLGNVYGGGNRGAVSGDSEVQIIESTAP